MKGVEPNKKQQQPKYFLLSYKSHHLYSLVRQGPATTWKPDSQSWCKFSFTKHFLLSYQSHRIYSLYSAVGTSHYWKPW